MYWWSLPSTCSGSVKALRLSSPPSADASANRPHSRSDAHYLWLWYAAGSLFAAPAVWLCDVLLSYLYPSLIDTAGLQGADMQLVTQFGESGGQLLTAKEAGNQIALEINTLLVSYSIAFYGALLMAANVQNRPLQVFSRALLALAYYGCWSRVDCRQRAAALNWRSILKHLTGASGRCHRPDLPIQCTSNANPGSDIFVVLAVERIPALGANCRRY